MRLSGLSLLPWSKVERIKTTRCLYICPTYKKFFACSRATYLSFARAVKSISFVTLHPHFLICASSHIIYRPAQQCRQAGTNNSRRANRGNVSRRAIVRDINGFTYLIDPLVFACGDLRTRIAAGIVDGERDECVVGWNSIGDICWCGHRALDSRNIWTELDERVIFGALKWFWGWFRASGIVYFLSIYSVVFVKKDVIYIVLYLNWFIAILI